MNPRIPLALLTALLTLLLTTSAHALKITPFTDLDSFFDRTLSWQAETFHSAPITFRVLDNPAKAPAPPTTASATTPAAEAPPYTDEQAHQFAAKLPDLTLPTTSTVDELCKMLGADPSRLTLRLGGPGGSTTVAQLSPTYWIAFEIGPQHVTTIVRVNIYKPQPK